MRLAFVIVAAMLAAAAPASAHRLDLDFRGEAIIPTGTMFEGTHGRRPVVDRLRLAARRLLHDLRRREPVPARALLHGRPRHRRRAADRRRRALQGRHDDARSRRKPVPGAQPRPRRARADRGPRAHPHVRGHRQRAAHRPVRAALLAGRQVPRRPAGAAGVPAHRRPVRGGVRQNLGFESAAADGHDLFVATENALFQDGPAATVANGSGRGSCATTCASAGSSASGSTTPIRSPSRRCPPPSSRSTGWWSCCDRRRQPASGGALAAATRRGPATRSSSSRCRCTGRRPASGCC